MTSKGNRYVLVVEDCFKSFVNLYPLPHQTAQSVAQCLLKDYVLVHGIPEVLHSDQASSLRQRLCRNCAISWGLKKLVLPLIILNQMA